MTELIAQRGWFGTLADVARDLTAIAMPFVLIVLAAMTWSFWRRYQRLRALLDRVNVDLTPLTRHATNIADNLDYITTSIRQEVQQVNATIASANRRLQQAVELTEHRLNEFNALLQVVQQEAEQAFVSTAAAVRGVRTGAATLGGMEDAEDDVDEPDDEGDEDGDDSEFDEDSAAAVGGRPTRPRLRRRGTAQRRHRE